MDSIQPDSLYLTYLRPDIKFDRGEGSYILTEDGERYLDFVSGIAVNTLGHADPRLIEALVRQAHKLWQTSNLYRVVEQEKLADRLTAETFADRVFFGNSGAEAVECAIKTARRYFAAKGQPERNRLVTFDKAFHGRTLGMIAAGGNKKHLDGFAPELEGFEQVAFADIDAVNAAVTDQTAGIILEPIQGEGGIREFPPGFVKELRALCDENGLLLIFDEVQSGVGRTGRLFAYEWWDVTPDIMCIAKGIGGGFPFGACLATEQAASGMTVGTHGSTFGGNPLAMAVGQAVMDTVLEPGFLDHVQNMGLLFKQKLAQIHDEFPGIIKEVRGRGLLVGLRFALPVKEAISVLMDQKMLTVGAEDDVMRLLPPLNVSEAEISEACSKIAAACAVLDRQMAVSA